MFISFTVDGMESTLEGAQECVDLFNQTPPRLSAAARTWSRFLEDDRVDASHLAVRCHEAVRRAAGPHVSSPLRQYQSVTKYIGTIGLGAEDAD